MQRSLPRRSKTRTPPVGGILSNLVLVGFFAGLSSRLLRLLLAKRCLTGLLTLLVQLVALVTLLRLALAFLIHYHFPKTVQKIIE
jgi:hypothetical protein